MECNDRVQNLVGIACPAGEQWKQQRNEDHISYENVCVYIYIYIYFFFKQPLYISYRSKVTRNGMMMWLPEACTGSFDPSLCFIYELHGRNQKANIL